MIRDIRRAVKALSPAGIGRHSELVDLLYAQKETHEALCKYITASNNESQLLLKFSKCQDDFTIREVSVRQAEIHWLADKIATEYADQYLQYRKAFKEVLAEQKLLDDIQKVKETCEAKVLKLRKQTEHSKKRSDAARLEAMQAEVAMAVSAAEESQTKYQIAKTKFEVYKAGKVKAALLTLADSMQLYHQRCGNLATTQQALADFIPDVPTPMTPEDMKSMDDEGVQLVRDVAEKLNMQNPPKEGGQEEGMTLHTYRPLTYQPSLPSTHMVHPTSPQAPTGHVQDGTTPADGMGEDRASPKVSIRKNPFDEEEVPPTAPDVEDSGPPSPSPPNSTPSLQPEGATTAKTTPSRPPPPSHPPAHTRDASPSTRDDLASSPSEAPQRKLTRKQSGKAPPPARPPPPKAATLPNRPPAPLPRPDLTASHADDSLDYSEPYVDPDGYIDLNAIVTPKPEPQQQAQQPDDIPQQPPDVAMPTTEVAQQPSEDSNAAEVGAESSEAAKQPTKPSRPPHGSLARQLSDALMRRQASGESVGEESALERSTSVTSDHSYVEIVDGAPQEEIQHNGDGDSIQLTQEDPSNQPLQDAPSKETEDQDSGGITFTVAGSGDTTEDQDTAGVVQEKCGEDGSRRKGLDTDKSTSANGKEDAEVNVAKSGELLQTGTDATEA
ncbi:PREDICTED: formin-like protein 5 [Branchiostoma belcheri]|uniref:Formin-like protein 5 n=1 Tax=Branchiostoma belcheri TaxID=7741 RepID=A0A6P4ZZI6_BRABE|nr:PREDICTED: formin-like protein 5 [Branchiostoma belcheri]